MAVVLITHDLGVVAQHVDRVMVMYAGRVVEEGSVMDAFARPSHPYTQGLLRSIPSIDEERDRLDAIPGMVPSPFALPPGCRFAPRCPHSQEACTAVHPPLIDAGEAHRAACIRLVDYDLDRLAAAP